MEDITKQLKEKEKFLVIKDSHNEILAKVLKDDICCINKVSKSLLFSFFIYKEIEIRTKSQAHLVISFNLHYVCDEVGLDMGLFITPDAGDVARKLDGKIEKLQKIQNEINVKVDCIMATLTYGMNGVSELKLDNSLCLENKEG